MVPWWSLRSIGLTAMRRKITKQVVATAKSQDREVIIWDTDVPGLGLRVTPSGARSYILKTRIGGGRSAPVRKPTLGKAGDLTPDQARTKARAWKALAADGVDPARHQQVAGRTVADLCAEYLEVHAPRKRSGEDDRAKINMHVLPRLGRRLVQDVIHADVERLHRAMKATPYSANRVVALLSKMFSLAMKWGWVDRNPAKGVEKYPEERRDRFLSPDEVSRLTEALKVYVDTAHRQKEAQKVSVVFRLLMLTGARRSEVLTMMWDHVDLETGHWTKPSSHTKQKREHRVPMSPPALELLGEIRARAGGTGYVFPSRPGAKHPHLTELKGAWAKICKLAGLDGVRIHDLRHTYASILVSGGASLSLIGALLGHTQTATTARYAHLMDDPLREATTRVGAVIDGNGGADAIKIGRP